MSSKDKIHVLSRAVIIDQNYILLCKTQDFKNNFSFYPLATLRIVNQLKLFFES